MFEDAVIKASKVTDGSDGVIRESYVTEMFDHVSVSFRAASVRLPLRMFLYSCGSSQD